MFTPYHLISLRRVFPSFASRGQNMKEIYLLTIPTMVSTRTYE